MRTSSEQTREGRDIPCGAQFGACACRYKDEEEKGDARSATTEEKEGDDCSPVQARRRRKETLSGVRTK